MDAKWYKRMLEYARQFLNARTARTYHDDTISDWSLRLVAQESWVNDDPLDCWRTRGMKLLIWALSDVKKKRQMTLFTCDLSEMELEQMDPFDHRATKEPEPPPDVTPYLDMMTPCQRRSTMKYLKGEPTTHYDSTEKWEGVQRVRRQLERASTDR